MKNKILNALETLCLAAALAILVPLAGFALEHVHASPERGGATAICTTSPSLNESSRVPPAN